MSASLNRIVAVNTLSNYVLIAIRIVYAVLITRFLYRALGVDYYGFWSILWALFTYVVIFNFGFGATIQKYTAEQLFETEPKKYNAIISLVVAFYIAASVVICVGAAVGIVWIRSWTNIESESILRDCRIALAIFTLGISAIFPLSVFSDILVGLKLIYLKNAVMVCMRLFEIAGVYTCITLDAGFTTIVSFSVGTNILFAIFLVFVVKKKIATFRLVPSFDFGLLREVGQFSFFVYINSLAMLVTAKSDRFILSSIIGLPAVGLYQIGSRLPDMSQQLSSQFQDNVIPVAANLAKNGKSSDLRKILLGGMRFSAFVSIGATAVFFCLASETIKALFGADGGDIAFVCRLLLVSQMIHCCLRNVPYRYLQIANRHKFIAASSAIQAITTVALGIVFCRAYGLSGICWAILLPNIAVSGGIIFPAALRVLRLGFSEIVAIFLKPAIAAIPAVAICAVSKQVFGEDLSTIFALCIVFSAAGMSYLLFGYLFVLTGAEKKFVKMKVINACESFLHENLDSHKM